MVHEPPSPADSHREPQVTEPEQAAPPCVEFEDLCPAGRELHIRFENQVYRLRVTKNGKLILNK